MKIRMRKPEYFCSSAALKFSPTKSRSAIILQQALKLPNLFAVVSDPRNPKVIVQTDLPQPYMRSNSLEMTGDILAVAAIVSTLLLGDYYVHGQEDVGSGVDGEGGADGVEGYVPEDAFHVLEAIDGDTCPANLALGAGVVRIEANLGRQVEGHAEARLTVLDEELVALVGILCGGKA